MTEIIFLLAFIFIAVVIQTTTGFGFGIVIMMVLPVMFTVTESLVLKSSINVLTIAYVAYTYRKHLDPKVLILPLMASMVMNFSGVTILGKIDNSLATFWLGIMLVILSVYFLIFSEKIHIKPSPVTALLCGGVSGLMGGMLGVGGPPIVLYYSAVIKKKEAYMATMQTYFLATALIRLALFASLVTIDVTILKLLPVAIITSMVAAYVGNKIYSRLPAKLIRKLIYFLMALSGIYYIFRT